jgi:hypothetical protein
VARELEDRVVGPAAHVRREVLRIERLEVAGDHPLEHGTHLLETEDADTISMFRRPP